MRRRKLKFLIFWSALLLMGACNLANNKNDIKSKPIDIKQEIGKWKQELLESRQIGSPCNYEHEDSLVRQKWRDDNPDQMDGLPFDEKEIKSVRFDFNNDGKEDLMLYLQGVNCTGHNGGTETFAKIIYSGGKSKSDLMNEIMTTIQTEYNLKRKTNKNLKEITDDYLKTTTTISGYENGIRGEFRLYTKDDAHCCPSYNGFYVYNLAEKKMKIDISENND